MIRNEKDYEATTRRIADAGRALSAQRAALEAIGVGPDGVRRALEPVEAMRAGLLEELARYEPLPARERAGTPDLRVRGIAVGGTGRCAGSGASCRRLGSA